MAYRSALVAILFAACLSGCTASEAGRDTVLGYVNSVPPESPTARIERRRRVERRRAGLPIIVHRGAWHAAPENTLEAYAAAIDLGADGVEIDIRRTADGVLYLFHDDTLDRLTRGDGEVSHLTYYELLQITPKEVLGRATPETRPPTLAAFLILARQRAMLIHLDIKEPGLEEDIARLLDAADAWDHVVQINEYHSATLRADPRLRLVAYAGWVPNDDGPDAIRAFCEEARRDGTLVFCDDPRPAVEAIGRAVPPPVALPPGIRAEWTPAGAGNG